MSDRNSNQRESRRDFMRMGLGFAGGLATRGQESRYAPGYLQDFGSA